MGTKNTVRLISAAGTSYYLSGGGSGQTVYAGSGTPWTAESTTPYELSLNDRTPIWIPGAAPVVPITSGAPPFNVGRRLLIAGYDTITEQVGVQLKATTKDNAIALLNQLRQIINTALFSQPCLVAVQGGTNTGYAEILWADIQETADYLAEPDGIMRATITWTRTPLWSAGALTTLQNGLTYNNVGTGANNNTQSLGTITGDLLYEGSPLNIKIAPASGDAIQYAYLATVYQRIYDAGIAATTTTSSTTGVNAFTSLSADVTDPARTRNGLRLRVILRCTSVSAKAQVQIALIGYVGTNKVLWLGPWVSGSATGATLMDITPQGVPLDVIRRASLESGRVDVAMKVRSTDGTSVSLNLHSAEFLLYYTFCRIDATGEISGTGGEWLQIEQAQNLNGTAYVPSRGAAFSVDTDTGTDYLVDICDMRGTLPRGISGASLYVAWMRTAYGYASSDVATVTTTHLPLYRTLRGNS